MDSTAMDKYRELVTYLRDLGPVAVAFSGGVDSTLLLTAAHEALGDGVLAVTAKSCSFPARELNEAKRFCQEHGIRHAIVESEELDIEGYSANPTNRCYLCKTELFAKIWQLARENGIESIAEGSNMDDNGDFRPGLMAISEQGVKSPLRECGLYKSQIREISKELGLSTWDKQSFACLSSRLPYGEEITPEKLDMIDKAEQLLLDKGFRQVRVRLHGKLGRIETDEEGIARLSDRALREEIYQAFRGYGFDYIASDLLGYRTGSMNEILGKEVLSSL